MRSRTQKHSRASSIIHYTPSPILSEPFELFIAICGVFAGIPYLTGHIRAGSLDQLLPWWLVRAWGGELIFGGIMTVTGLLLRKPIIERGGILPLGLAAFIYALSIAYFAGLSGIYIILVDVGFGIAAVSRYIAIRVAQHLVQEVIRHSDE